IIDNRIVKLSSLSLFTQRIKQSVCCLHNLDSFAPWTPHWHLLFGTCLLKRFVMEPNNNASLLEKLQLRMKEVEDDKETIQYKLNLLESKIKTAIATLPKRPNVDESKIEEQIRKLDFQRETRTMTPTRRRRTC
ncbi:unnamed protein product, partial [Heterosigma akashiwo]